MNKQKRSKIRFILNVVFGICCLLYLFGVKSVYGDVLIISDISKVVSWFQNVPLLADVYESITNVFGTNDIVYLTLTFISLNVLSWCSIDLPLNIIDFIKGSVCK
jgi:hypothetical protein